MRSSIEALIKYIEQSGVNHTCAGDEILSRLRAILSSLETGGRAERDAFKDFVHRRLDTAGVPKEFPDGKHTKEGCRIGDRLDWVLERMETEGRNALNLQMALELIAILESHGWVTLKDDRFATQRKTLENLLVAHFKKCLSENGPKSDAVVGVSKEKRFDLRIEDGMAWSSPKCLSPSPSEANAQAMEALQERIAILTAHRACCGTEADPSNGKLHGYCVVCGVPWPCEYAGKLPSTIKEQPPQKDLGEHGGKP